MHLGLITYVRLRKEESQSSIMICLANLPSSDEEGEVPSADTTNDTKWHVHLQDLLCVVVQQDLVFHADLV